MVRRTTSSDAARGLAGDFAREGQGLVEYALILTLLAMALVGVVYGYGGVIDQLYQFIIAGFPAV
jgi:Flp pilus assembly pilin Flp